MRGHELFRAAAAISAILCYTTILIGGTVMANDDGLGCPNWPMCYPNNSPLPAVHGAAVVEWSHRVAAFFLATAIGTMALLGVAYERGRPVLLRLSLLAAGFVAVEAALGGWVVRSDLVTALVLVHLALATALFGLLLVLVLLSNLRALPRRWVDWALRASEESAPSSTARSLADERPVPESRAPGRPQQS